MTTKGKNIIGWVILAVVVVAICVGVYLSLKPEFKSNPQLDQFAKCLASKNITMYGAAWCPHCQKQKALFGQSFKYVPYVECPDNQKLCLDKGINGYPTWITSDGKKVEGEQTLENLSALTSCTLPTGN